jgi:hypothetical protein
MVPHEQHVSAVDALNSQLRDSRAAAEAAVLEAQQLQSLLQSRQPAVKREEEFAATQQQLHELQQACAEERTAHKRHAAQLAESARAAEVGAGQLTDKLHAVESELARSTDTLHRSRAAGEEHQSTVTTLRFELRAATAAAQTAGLELEQLRRSQQASEEASLFSAAELQVRAPSAM